MQKFSYKDHGYVVIKYDHKLDFIINYHMRQWASIKGR